MPLSIQKYIIIDKQQSDKPLRDFLKGKKQVVDVDEDFIELALLAQKMGKEIFIVVEKLNELKLIISMAKMKDSRLKKRIWCSMLISLNQYS
jgi:hypothetical protein